MAVLKYMLIPTLLFLPLVVFSQNCDCETKFQWTKETFEQNDAGFRMVLEQKGIELYKNHNKRFLLKAKEINNNSDCYELMRNWMKFFRKGHFGIRPLNQETNRSTEIKEWETLTINLQEFKKELSKKNTNDYEGIWVSEPYTIGVKKFGDEYRGFIIEAKNSQWKKGEVKLIINPNNSCTYYMGDYSAKYFDHVTLLGDNYLQSGHIIFKRVFPNLGGNSEIERYYKSITSNKPYLEHINQNTLFLRIPTFDSNQKQLIDSILSTNHRLITSTQNLIIDLRNNGGGSDRSFQELLPILYTNPIRTVGVELLSTPKNNERVKNFISHPNASQEFKTWAKAAFTKLSENIGGYVNVDSVKTTITKFDTIYSYPRNVGIIINQQNASTTEQFLLAAKQSKKVKLFGQTTFGALDISYTYPAKSPCDDFELIYCLSKSLRIPEMTIDGKGIQPDYYIDEEIPKYEWINFVTKILN